MRFVRHIFYTGHGQHRTAADFKLPVCEHTEDCIALLGDQVFAAVNHAIHFTLESAARMAETRGADIQATVDARLAAIRRGEITFTGFPTTASDGTKINYSNND